MSDTNRYCRIIVLYLYIHIYLNREHSDIDNKLGGTAVNITHFSSKNIYRDIKSQLL